MHDTIDTQQITTPIMDKYNGKVTRGIAPQIAPS